MMFRLILSFILLFICAVPAAQAKSLIESSAAQAILIDYDTGAVLYEKNADERMPTSSMSKVLTAYLAFDALQRGDIALDDTVLVSEKAWRKGGSKMFIEVGKKVTFEDLIRGVLVQSGNDATIALAEGIAGSEDTFVNMMNNTAQRLGMRNSHFMNASGWPDPEHYSTARDLAIMARAAVKNFPEYLGYFSETEFTYNDITQRNRNPLLYRDIGADGMKTGHTEAAGYGLIGTGMHKGRRAIAVVNGLDSSKARAQEGAKLLDWGLKRFENRVVYQRGDIVEHTAVLMGQAKSTPVVVDQDIIITVPKIARDDVKVEAKFDGPVEAPVSAGQAVGLLEIIVPHIGTEEYKLHASQDIAELGFVAKTIEQARMFVMERL